MPVVPPVVPPVVRPLYRPLYQGVRRSVWDPETSRERVGDWCGPETVWSLSPPRTTPPLTNVFSLWCVAARRATRPNGEWGYSTRRHMLGPERPDDESTLPPLFLAVFGSAPKKKKKSQISKKILKSPTILIVISHSLKPVKISYANGRVSVRIFYKNNSSPRVN